MLRPVHRLALRVFDKLPIRVRRRIVRVVAPSFYVGAVCCIERDDGAILLVRPCGRERWVLPGGLLREGESAFDGVRREVLEEVGTELVLVGEPAVVVDGPSHRVDVVFRGRLADPARAGTVVPASPEIDEARWFHAAAFPRLQDEAAHDLVVLARATPHLPAPAIPTDVLELQVRG